MTASVTTSIHSRSVSLSLRDPKACATLTISVEPRGASLTDIMRHIEHGLKVGGYESTHVDDRRHKRR